MSEDELPEGWTEASLNDILEPNGLFDGPFGSNLKTSDYTDVGIRVIRLENLANLRFLAERETYISEAKYRELTKHTIVAGDIIVGSFVDGAMRVCVLPPLRTKAIAKADCFTVRTRTDLADRRFVAYQLGTTETRDALVEEIHGATRPRITTKQLRDFKLRLPSLVEQRRIVAKVESLLSQVNKARERLDRVSLVIKRFRQSLLAAACSGELIGETGNVDGPFEFLRAIPNSWRWMTAKDACARVVDCHNKTAPYTDSGTRLLRTTNIRGGRLILDDARYVSEETYRFWSRRCPPQAGDVLFTREAPMGEAALIPSGLRVCMGQRMMLLRADPAKLTPEFLLLAVQSPHVLKYAEHVAVGSGVLHMRVGDVERLPLPVPPLRAQHDIVTKVHMVLSEIDRLEAHVCLAAADTAAAPRTILTTAFSGEL